MFSLAAQKTVSFKYKNTYLTARTTSSVKFQNTEFRLDNVSSSYNAVKRSVLPYFHDLQNYKVQYQLSDYKFIHLLHAYVKSQPMSHNQSVVTLAALLELSGLEIELAYTRTELFLFVQCEEDIYEIPFVQLDNKNFLNIFLLLEDKYIDNQDWYYNTHIHKKLDGKPLSFLNDQNSYAFNLVKKQFTFNDRGENINLEVSIDKSSIDEWETYPHLSESTYIEHKMNSITVQELKAQLTPYLQNRTTKEQVELLINFVRNGLSYAADEDFFGKSRPLNAEETLFYPYSDCEDRCALFYQLVDELLGLPVITIGIPNHMTAAVSFDTQDVFEKEVQFEGRRYIICDPTGPENSSEIGILNIKYDVSEMEVISNSSGRYLNN